MDIYEQNDYKTFAISSSLSSVSQTDLQLSLEEQDSVQNSYTLSGNVDVGNISAYNQSPCYSYQLLDPYAGHSSDPVEVWGAYFADMVAEIKANVRRRNGNAVPLDFADLMIVLASLSSLIQLQASDLAVLPNTEQEYNNSTCDNQRRILKRDNVLFRWFVSTFMFPNEQYKENLSVAMYTSLRCGIIHNMTIGQIVRQNGYGHEITLSSRNPKMGKTNWYEINQTNPNCVSFYLSEMLSMVEALIANLFAPSTTDRDCQRFQNDAVSVLSGKSPVKLLKATKKEFTQSK